MLNIVHLQGRLTRDPEVRVTGSGITVTAFTVAVDRDTRTDGGEKETDFFDCTAWRGTAEFVAKYFFKGSMINIEGRLGMEKWTDRNGNGRVSPKITAERVWFCGSKNADSRTAQPAQNFQVIDDDSALPFTT